MELGTCWLRLLAPCLGCAAHKEPAEGCDRSCRPAALLLTPLLRKLGFNPPLKTGIVKKINHASRPFHPKKGHLQGGVYSEGATTAAQLGR